jgi:uncharacterized protein
MAAPHAPVARPKPKAEEGMKRSISIIAVLGLALAPMMALAQAPAGQQPAAAPQQDAMAIPADQQATQQQIAKLFEVMRLHQQLDRTLKMLPMMMQRQMQAQEKEALSRYPKAQQLTPEQQAALDKLMQKYMQQAMDIYPVDEMMGDATTVYQRHMSREDVDAYITFYNSPPGQHLLDAQPVILKEYMTLVMQKMQTRSQKLNESMAEDIKEFVASQTPASQAPAAPKN